MKWYPAVYIDKSQLNIESRVSPLKLTEEKEI